MLLEVFEVHPIHRSLRLPQAGLGEARGGNPGRPPPLRPSPAS
jgi:hypothetical protein